MTAFAMLLGVAFRLRLVIAVRSRKPNYSFIVHISAMPLEVAFLLRLVTTVRAWKPNYPFIMHKCMMGLEVLLPLRLVIAVRMWKLNYCFIMHAVFLLLLPHLLLSFPLMTISLTMPSSSENSDPLRIFLVRFQRGDKSRLIEVVRSKISLISS